MVAKKKKIRYAHTRERIKEEIMVTTMPASAVSNYKDVNAKREFDGHFQEKFSFSRCCPAENDPSSYIREIAIYATCIRILCVMHTCMIHVHIWRRV